MSAPIPNNLQQYVDRNGRLTVEGMKLLQQMAAYIDALETRIAALEP